jgi:hypothetical protein
MLDQPETEGLGMTPESEWKAPSSEQRPIYRLKPESELHKKVLKYLLTRLEMSEQAMQEFYPRWQVNEKKYQAYIDLPDWEKLLKEMTDAGGPAKVVSITVPYSFATLSTIVTYLMQTFTGRKPMFQIGSYKAKTANSSSHMEIALQYQADHSRLIKHLYQFLQDGEMYGVSVLKTKWTRKTAKRTVWKSKPSRILLGAAFGGGKEKVKEDRTVYAGNEVSAIDPYMFFPDPRVPMAEVNRRGEFVFWRVYEGKHMLKREEAKGTLAWVDAARQNLPVNRNGSNDSARQLLSGGQSAPYRQYIHQGVKDFFQIDQGSVEIIPKELGLGDSTIPEKWIFTILNKSQIVQAEPLGTDHGMHPLVVSEPYTQGYGFGNMGMMDHLGPIQDTLSWFINSHIDNVRTALNNMFIVDPSMIEMQDLKEPGAGKIVRLKPAHYGRDVRSALHQLQVYDVTGNHINDFENLMRLGDSLSSVTDNLRGLSDSGSRKTATEVRTSGEAAASRLAAHSRVISAQAIVDLTEQWSVNTQQYMDEEFYIHLLGDKLLKDPIQVSPEMLVGDFYYPVHDGALPLDKVAMLDVWKEIFMGVAQDPSLRQQFDVVKIFEHVAELGGARNIDSFKLNLNVASDQQLAAQAQAGNVVPVGG